MYVQKEDSSKHIHTTLIRGVSSGKRAEAEQGTKFFLFISIIKYFHKQVYIAFTYYVCNCFKQGNQKPDT